MNFNSVKAWLAISPTMRQTFLRAGYPPDRLCCLHHSWDIQPPVELNLDHGYFLFLGRMVEAKGVRFLVDLWQRPEFKGLQLVMAGEGELADEYRGKTLPRPLGRCCEVLRLRSLPLDQVSQGLADMWGYLPDQARLLAHVSGGQPGYARRLGEDNALLAQRKDWLDIHTHLLEAGRVERFNYIEKLSKDRQHFKENLRGALTTWLSFWNDVLLRAGGAEIPLINLEYNEEIEKLAAQLSLESSMQVVASLGRALELLQTNVNPRLAAEALMLDLPYR